MYSSKITTRPEAVSCLSDHGLGVSGSKQELINRIRLHERYPNLVKN